MTAFAATVPVARRRTRSAFVSGARDLMPMVIGVLPLGLAIGTVIADSSVPPMAGWLAGPLIFGGAAQLLTVEMLDSGAAPVVIVVSALLVNSRIMVYGAAIAPWFREASLRDRLLVAAPLIDPLFLVCEPRFAEGDQDQRERIAYYAGGATLLLVAWMAVQAVAIGLTTSVPASAGLHLAAPLAFVGMLANATKSRPAVASAAVACFVAVAGTGLPYQSAMSLGIVAGLVAGIVTARIDRRAEAAANENEDTEVSS